MPVLPIKSYTSGKNFNKHDLVKITGYGALAAGGASLVQASRHKFKSHKMYGVLTIFLSLAHLGIIKYLNHK